MLAFVGGDGTTLTSDNHVSSYPDGDGSIAVACVLAILGVWQRDAPEVYTGAPIRQYELVAGGVGDRVIESNPCSRGVRYVARKL